MREEEHIIVSLAWHYHEVFFNIHVICFLFREQPCKHSQSCLSAFTYSIYLYKRDLKLQEKISKCLVKAVFQEDMKNHMPYKPLLASQHFLKSSVLICQQCLPSDNLSLPPISILKIKCFTLITSQTARGKNSNFFSNHG